MQVTNKKNADGSIDITISLDANEVICLKHDLPGDQGIFDWFSKGPSKEKCFKCKERMLNEWIPKLRAKGTAIPSDDTTLINSIIADVDYKDRAARDLENAL